MDPGEHRHSLIDPVRKIEGNCFDCRWLTKQAPYYCERLADITHGKQLPAWFPEPRFPIFDGRLGVECKAFVRKQPGAPR